MIKKKWYIGCAITALLLVGCGDDSSSNSKETAVEDEKESKAKVLAAEDFNKMYTSPKDYKGYEVTYTGQLLFTPEEDEDGLYLQIYADPENSDLNTIVYFPDSTFEIEEEDYVKVTGIVKDEYTGENLMGGELTMPMIEATNLEVVSYIDAIAPTTKTIDINQTKDQHGYQLTLEKVELADTQTRLYFTVSNNSQDTINFYTFDTKIVANGAQLEEIDMYGSGLPEIQSDILPGTSTSGVIAYPALEEGTTTIQVYSEGYSENYEITIEPFTFDVTIQ